MSIQLDLSGQTAFVTGSSRGIGAAIARCLRDAECAVYLHCSQDLSSAEALAAEIGALGVIQADLSTDTGIDSVRDRLSETRLDILVNNAGVWRHTPLGGTDRQLFDSVVALNMRSVFLLTQELLGSMRDGGRIVNISSVAGKTASAEGRSVYRASKAAVDSFTRNWALELAPRRILVNAVAPGMVESDMTREHLKQPQVEANLRARHPLGKFADTNEIAEVVLFLCSRAARFITGQVINVSGGFVI